MCDVSLEDYPSDTKSLVEIPRISYGCSTHLTEIPFALRDRGIPVYVSERSSLVDHPGAVSSMLPKSDELEKKNDRMKHRQLYGYLTCRVRDVT